VQASLSLHDVPLALGAPEQDAVSALHAPASWHASPAVQFIGFAPVHFWFWQVDVPVHGFWSLHVVPFV
jgi:hypothetical protein